MNVDMGHFSSNLSKLRVARIGKFQLEEMKVVEEQKRNAEMGLAI